MAKAKAAFAEGLTAEIGSQATVTLLTYSSPPSSERMLQEAGDGVVIVDFLVEDIAAEAKLSSLATGVGTTSLVAQLSTSLTAKFPGIAGVSSALVRAPSTQSVSINVYLTPGRGRRGRFAGNKPTVFAIQFCHPL